MTADRTDAMSVHNESERMATRPISADELTRIAQGALEGAGVTATGADTVTRILVSADLFGIHTHGVHRIPQYLERARLQGINVAPDVGVDRVAPGLALVDGDNGIGPIVADRALGAALDGAREAGIGAAFVRGSNHFGALMPYLFEAASAGCAALVASNATTTIAPSGGRQTKIGNNPLGWGVPTGDDDPVMLDMALSVVARAKIRAAAAAGDRIPATWATDQNGQPTTDPAVALDGFLQPIGAHKGSGLSIMIDLFAGVLSGASYLDRIGSWSTNPERPQDLGHLFVLVDTTVLDRGAGLDKRFADFRERLLTTPAADPATPVRLPGEIEMANRRRQMTDGIDIETADLEALEKLAASSTM